MKQNKQVVRALTLTIPIIVGVGIAGAIYLTRPANTEVLVTEKEVQDSDRERQDVVDSKSVVSASQVSLNLNEDSLIYALREYGNLFDLKRLLLRLVDEATEDELVQIFHESREYPLAFDSIQTTHWLRSVVLSKLLDIDGDKVASLIDQFDEQTAGIVVYGVMHAWNQMYLDKAIKFLDLFDRDLQEQGLLGLIDGSASIDRADFIEMGTDLGFHEVHLTSLLDRHQLDQDQSSLDDISIELDYVVSNDHAQFHEVLRKAVGYVRAEGLDSLPRVLELFDEQSVNNMSQTTRMFFDGTQSRLVSDISRGDPERVFEYLVSLGEPLDVDLLSAVSNVWFATDPEALWSRLKGEDVKGIQEEVTEDIVRHWTLREPELALVSLDQLPAEYNDLVYVEIAREVAKDSPLEALELLRETSDWTLSLSDREESEKNSGATLETRFSIRRTILAAARTDPMATIKWIESEESKLDDSMKAYHLDSAFQSWAKLDPDTAFELALQTPLPAESAGFEARVVGSLASQDVDQAMNLLPRVRDGETKIAAYQNVMRQLEEQDRIPDALDLGSDLPEHERKEYNKSLAWQISDREPFDHLIAGIRALPTQELQSRVIRTRLMFKYWFPDMAPKITNKQLDQFKEFLTDSEKRLLEMARRVYADRISPD